MLHLEKFENSKRDNVSKGHMQSNHQDFERSSTSGTQTETHTFNTQVEKLPSSTNNVQAYLVRREGTTVLPTALIYIDNSGELFTIRALLDAGAERSFITTRIHKGLQYHSSHILVKYQVLAERS